jgi:hypothetical protein
MLPSLSSFNLKLVVISLGVPILLMGCSGYQYVASPRFVPLNEKKGDLTANLYPSGLQVGYAFTNKFSVFATGFKRFPTLETKNPISDGKDHRSGESKEINIGLSYFKKKEHLLYEILVGAGLGSMSFANDFKHNKNRDVNYTFEMEARRKNIFIQPNFTWKFNKPAIDRRLAIAVFTKFNFIQYYDIRTEYSAGTQAKPDSGVDYFRTQTEADLFFIEPGIVVKGGFKNFKGMIQGSPIINLSGHALHYNIFSVNMGVAINFNLLTGNK